MTAGEIRAFVAGSRWIPAKTMPSNPHEYTLKRDAADKAAFRRFVEHIRAAGHEAIYGGVPYLVFDVDGHRYWTMGDEVEKTILINRRRLEETLTGAENYLGVKR